MPVVLHVLQSLKFGGMERGTLQVARRGRREGQDHRILLFDAPYRASEDEYDASDVPVLFVPRRPGVDVTFPLRLAQALKQERVRVLHARNDTAVSYSALAVELVRPKPKLIATFHTYPSHPTSRARLLTRWASQRAHAVTAVSGELSDRLVREGWIAHCRTIWNGVELQEFSCTGDRLALRKRLGISQQEFLIGCVGRLEPIKRHCDLIAAARILANRPSMPKFHVVLVGDGSLAATLRTDAAKTRHISVLPATRNIPEVLLGLDLLVLCSTHEGAPRALLEAMAARVAIVATQVGGIPAILTGPDGPCGGLVQPLAPEVLADAIMALATNPEERGRLASAGYERVQGAFSCDREWRDYTELYRDPSAQ